MALKEETKIDKYEIVGDFKIVQVRTATIIKKDGTEISRTFHRHTVAPDADITSESAEIQEICKIVHTDKIKKDYATYLKSLED